MDKLFKFRTNISAFRRYLSTPVPPSNQNGSNISPQYRPSELQKLILVWTKKYKSKEDIPQLVAYVTATPLKFKNRVTDLINSYYVPPFIY